ncbi:uncharacterized protein M421DRAFT_64786 [Didymella exigua CBS 183.55]|uniref:Micro-fibrillar-associated protein 1 C-terminal domain-containing protein n=1 Tax=Didymella exigua CBS 183.55 TaxID=1150837 RepID=A0A6A5RJH7_9PLEO|nr:uncharacterized protein M421DRAFT_64786 [Didymella exigua CBS 183.55]KAF1927789.1 hypothetical protein M421DRAFT_64786 [Didymella exigua CBS 183.55]
MPPPKSKKLTAQPIRTRQFAGKPGAAPAAEQSSSSESESEDEPQPKPKPFAKPKPAPIASSFPRSAPRAKLAARPKPDIDEDEFETESEDGNAQGERSGSGSDESSSNEESGSSEEDDDDDDDESSADEAPRKLVRPVFIKKSARTATSAPAQTPEQMAAADEARRHEATKQLVQAQVEARLAERAAAKKDWDDDVEDADINAIDDADGLDPAAEFLAWKLRELHRIKRERVAIETAEAERAEVERRQALSKEERDAEDAAHIAKQADERDGRGPAQFMQKYFHKGAFFTDELAALGLDKRNLMGARFEDQTDREVLPAYMQIRDMTKLGKKGGTRYKDMRSEDTGRWGDYGDDRPKRGQEEYGLDERFRSDAYRGSREEGPSGANARPLGERKRGGDEGGREGKRPRIDERA